MWMKTRNAVKSREIEQLSPKISPEKVLAMAFGESDSPL
jgi:hypothetical protein